MKPAWWLLFAAPVAAQEARVLDDFEQASAWTASASDQVFAMLSAIDSRHGRGLCLDYDFRGVSGHAAMRRELPLEFPPDFEFRFEHRGNGPANQFEFKLVDESGENVWWVARPNTVFPADWAPLAYKKRQIVPAWGPLQDKTLRKTRYVEFTVYANQGGRGAFCVDDLRLAKRTPQPETWPAPKASASSGQGAQKVADPAGAMPWQTSKGGEQTLTLDFGAPREFGGLVLDWMPGAAATAYTVQLGDDGKTWRDALTVTQGDGGTDWLRLGETESRWLRLALHAGQGEGYALRRFDVRQLAFGDANTFVEAMASREGPSLFPRGFSGQQSYWTVVGVDGGADSGLLSEDGALEVGRGGFSLQPFVLDATGCASGAPQLTGWPEAAITQSLPEGYLPMPQVHWQRAQSGCDGGGAWALDIEAFAAGTREAARMIARYTLRNAGTQPRTLTLALAAQPFQVNPPVQFLTTPGGVSPIHKLSITPDQLHVDGRARVFALDAPQRQFASAFDAGLAASHLARGSTPATRQVEDATGLASGAWVYEFELAPGASRSIAFEVPLGGAHAVGGDAAWVQALHEETAKAWHGALDGVTLRLPPAQRALADTLRTALAHVLVNRNGVQIRPGTRSYARSWIRDGAMTSEALLRLGHGDAAVEFLKWYAPYQFLDGKVPCCVDARGSDPVPENDSHGELLFLIGEAVRYTADLALAEAMWPRVQSAARYLDTLRAKERTPQNQGTERYGLLPPSISHEGYSAKPAYSHWDNFWGLIGYKSALAVAQMLGRANEAKWLAQERDAFRIDILASIEKTGAARGIDFIPGAADLGDFDATSTTIALSPGGESAQLPKARLEATFERYWREFVERRDGQREWQAYTPYEWRNVAAFVRLGWRARAQEAIAFFMRDRRPAAWNQWAEVVGRAEREPRFIGDMPHGWVASDFIRSTLDLFAYEREQDRALVLAAGLPPSWLEGEGTGIAGLRTPWGALDYTLRREGARVHVAIREGIRMPPGGLVIAWPLEQPPKLPKKSPLEWRDGELVVRRVPLDVVLEL
jgi:hypothetical protein